MAALQAEHSHAQWTQALQKLDWQYGAQFDPVKQTHPHLKPFKDLPASVREEKRQVFLDNLKVLLALGYHLESRPSPTSRAFGHEVGATLPERGGVNLWLAPPQPFPSSTNLPH
jgi:hypothetical protein